MMAKSNIEWTESSWNPVTGCTKISPGCKHCYAERLSKRLKAMGLKNYQNGFKVSLHESMLNRPLEWKKPQRIFVNSMSDLFHEEVPLWFVKQVFSIMNQAYWHQFQVLTKRSERLEELACHFNWTPNIWMGVSVENQDCLFRIKNLKNTPAQIKFMSIEPLLGSISNIEFEGIDWVIVGGESGPKARPMKYEWVEDIKNQCLASDTPFFFKQWGGINRKKAGRELDGQTWDEYPIAIDINNIELKS
jgi:protein gp37